MEDDAPHAIEGRRGSRGQWDRRQRGGDERDIGAQANGTNGGGRVTGGDVAGRSECARRRTGTAFAAIVLLAIAAINALTTATLASGNYIMAGFVSGQGASVTQTSGTYASADAGAKFAADFAAAFGKVMALDRFDLLD